MFIVRKSKYYVLYILFAGFKATEVFSEIALFGHLNDDQSITITVDGVSNKDNNIINHKSLSFSKQDYAIPQFVKEITRVQERHLDICEVEVVQTETSEDESKTLDKKEEICLTAIDEVGHDIKFRGERQEVGWKEVEKKKEIEEDRYQTNLKPIEHKHKLIENPPKLNKNEMEWSTKKSNDNTNGEQEDDCLSTLYERTGDANRKAEFERQMMDHPVFKKYKISSVSTTTSKDEIIDVISLKQTAVVQSNETPSLPNITQNHPPPQQCNTLSLTKAPATSHSPGDVPSLFKCLLGLSVSNNIHVTTKIENLLIKVICFKS